MNRIKGAWESSIPILNLRGTGLIYEDGKLISMSTDTKEVAFYIPLTEVGRRITGKIIFEYPES
jgi:hypothetical protein